MKRRAVFLDRDGTIIEEKNYLSNPAQVILINGAAQAIRRLSKAGFLIVMVSNQSGVARGKFTEETVNAVNQQVEHLLWRQGAKLDAVYFCPHHEEGSCSRYAVSCNCRKPKPGMGLRAARELSIDLAESFMVGDKHSDIEFGQNCGMKGAYLVLTGHGRQQQFAVEDGRVVRDIQEAAGRILETLSSKGGNP